MKRYSVGKTVLIRYGRHQGQPATIIKNPQTDVYKVKAEDGFILYFSSKGLASNKEEFEKPVG
jgi:hypothetical protein